MIGCGLSIFAIAGRGRLPLATQIAQLFKNNEQGVWYDPSDLSTLFQDSAGTTPVTAMEQPVGLMLDKSGRGNHASQPTATCRPILQQLAGGQNYLLFDGIDDFLVTPSINFSATDKMTVWAGVRKLSDAQFGTILELSAAPTNNGIIGLYGPGGAGLATLGSRTRGTADSYLATVTTYAAPLTSVLTAQSDIAGDGNVLRVNGTGINQSADQGTGNYGNHPLYIGRRGGTSLPFNGHLYQLILRGALSSDAQIRAGERLQAQRTGVQLS